MGRSLSSFLIGGGGVGGLLDTKYIKFKAFSISLCMAEERSQSFLELSNPSAKHPNSEAAAGT